jgi:hemerythrin-like domain-containing protein
VTGQQKPDLLVVTLIHQALRADADRMVTTASALNAVEIQRLHGLRLFFDEYREQLCLHHAHEDDLFFPALVAVIEESRIPIAELAVQHGSLDSDLQAIRDGLASVGTSSGDFAAEHAEVVSRMTGMAKHLDAHLTTEEETVLPLMASAVPHATYKQLEDQARKLTPRCRAQFLIPWIVGHANPDQRRELFRSAPPLRAAYLVNRHRYRRLDRFLLVTPSPPQSQHASGR